MVSPQQQRDINFLTEFVYAERISQTSALVGYKSEFSSTVFTIARNTSVGHSLVQPAVTI